MESVVTRYGGASEAAAAPGVGRQQRRLAVLRQGERARVLKVRGTDELHHHLENLGFVPGAGLRVVSEQGGNVIVEIKGAQIALDRAAASKVITN